MSSAARRWHRACVSARPAGQPGDQAWLSWAGDFAQAATIELYKLFHVEPGHWLAILFEEELWLNGNLLETRPVEILRRLRVYLPLVLRAYP